MLTCCLPADVVGPPAQVTELAVISYLSSITLILMYVQHVEAGND